MSEIKESQKNNTKKNNGTNSSVNSNKTYAQIYNDAKTKHENHVKFLSSALDDSVKALLKEGKEKEAIRKQLLDDWVKTGMCSRTSVQNSITKEFNPEVYNAAQARKQEQYEKKKIAVANGGEQILEGGDSGEPEKDVSKMTPQEAREYYKGIRETKAVQKGNRQIQTKAAVIGKSDLDNEDDDDDEQDQTQQESEIETNSPTVISQGIKNVVLDHEDDYKSLIELMSKNPNRAIIFQVNLDTLEIVGQKIGGELKKG